MGCMKYKFTHVADQVGCDARTSDSYIKKIRIRTTNNFYVDENLSKYYRNAYMGVGVGDWPMYKIINIERARPLHVFRHMWE